MFVLLNIKLIKTNTILDLSQRSGNDEMCVIYAINSTFK